MSGDLQFAVAIGKLRKEVEDNTLKTEALDTRLDGIESKLESIDTDLGKIRVTLNENHDSLVSYLLSAVKNPTTLAKLKSFGKYGLLVIIAARPDLAGALHGLLQMLGGK